MSEQAPVTVRELVAGLDRLFPFQWAEPWDRVGLVAGDPDRPLRSVLVTLDADRSAVRRAVQGGHDLLLTHHPALLDVSLPLLPTGSEATLFDALSAGISLVCCHTNLDRAPSGADALPRLLGLHVLEPLEAAVEPVSMITTFAPTAAASGIREALAAAGAGRIGMYSKCAFESPGTGFFEANEGSVPTPGPLDVNQVSEVRLEAVVASGSAGRVVAALRAAHPYHEPVITVVDGGLSRGVARLGRLCEVPEPMSLRTFAAECASALNVDARVWGDPETMIRLIAVGNGSAGSLIDRAIASGADVLLAGEVRYHDARAALDAGLAVVEAGHDATEWPLVHVLADAAREILTEHTRVSEEAPAVGWWTTERR
jgi:dinuclear metal center YbgI/SA1388 family protein